MTTLTPAAAIRNAPERSFVRVTDLPGTATAKRQALSRAARDGELVAVRRGLYYRGVRTAYGMTTPSTAEIVREVLGSVGVGPAGYSAAREWGVTTQVPPFVHVATLRKVDAIGGVKQTLRRNVARAELNAKEIALLELLRAPEVYVEAGWSVLAANVQRAAAAGEIRVGRVREVARSEFDVAVRENVARLMGDVRPVAA